MQLCRALVGRCGAHISPLPAQLEPHVAAASNQPSLLLLVVFLLPVMPFLAVVLLLVLAGGRCPASIAAPHAALWPMWPSMQAAALAQLPYHIC